jgi:hypothetical protein
MHVLMNVFRSLQELRNPSQFSARFPLYPHIC